MFQVPFRYFYRLSICVYIYYIKINLWVWRSVPRPVLGSRIALFGLALRPLLFTTRVLGGVSVGVPRFRGRALRVFWETESGCVFNPVHLTAADTGQKTSKIPQTQNSYCQKSPQLFLWKWSKLLPHRSFAVSKEPMSREGELWSVCTCCKACLYGRHRTGAFTFTVSHQWGGEAHQAIIHSVTKPFKVSFFNSWLRTNIPVSLHFGKRCPPSLYLSLWEYSSFSVSGISSSSSSCSWLRGCPLAWTTVNKTSWMLSCHALYSSRNWRTLPSYVTSSPSAKAASSS